ncbi:hypothetical protein QBC34DRAFT_388880 [Podospora aff. communis PSN243]|uniref:Glutathione S-transferase n=1 Tax=Podospora aff. communis PSN243 TaxID=3040156 RepID=A0AAV9H938_9PEZI|nr:hypothetical protein QBC34DRAFT_388880 [Podospora aff. communis PSN243]
MADTSDAKITLHWLNGSRAQGTMFLLEELGIPYDIDVHHRDLKTKLSPPAADALHPLGKFPIVTITSPSLPSTIRLAESAFIIQYLTDHFPSAKKLAPARWKPGQEGKLGGESESWMRYQYLMYYVEGSYMFTMLLYFFAWIMKSNQVTWLIRPITSFIGNKLIAALVFPNAKKHFTMLEHYLETSPDGGSYLCGPDLTGADIMLTYPLLSGLEINAFEDMGSWEKGSFKETFPKLQAYILRLSDEEGWKKSVEKIKELEGGFSIMP